MKVRHTAIALASIGLLFGACSRTTISPNWGVAYQEMRASQILDPTAGEKLDPGMIRLLDQRFTGSGQCLHAERDPKVGHLNQRAVAAVAVFV